MVYNIIRIQLSLLFRSRSKESYLDWFPREQNLLNWRVGFFERVEQEWLNQKSKTHYFHPFTPFQPTLSLSLCILILIRQHFDCRLQKRFRGKLSQIVSYKILFYVEVECVYIIRLTDKSKPI